MNFIDLKPGDLLQLYNTSVSKPLIHVRSRPMFKGIARPLAVHDVVLALAQPFDGFIFVLSRVGTGYVFAQALKKV